MSPASPACRAHRSGSSGRPKCPGRRSPLAPQVIEDVLAAETMGGGQGGQVHLLRAGDPAALPQDVQGRGRVRDQACDSPAVVGDGEGLTLPAAAEALRAVVAPPPMRDRAHAPSLAAVRHPSVAERSNASPATTAPRHWRCALSPPPNITR